MGIAKALTIQKTFTRVAPEPTQTRLGVGGQALTVNLPTPKITRHKMIGAAGFFDITIASAEQTQTAQHRQSTEQT